jgi:hypothetical protein
VLKEETLDVIRTMARYNACLKEKYGVDLNDVGESEEAWEHLIAAGQRGLEPEIAVGQLASNFGLVSSSSPFVKTLQCAEIYNRYRLALMKYAEENNLLFSSPGNPVQKVPGVDYYLHWNVDPVRDKDDKIIGCKFSLYDPRKWSFYDAGVDINDALENARTAILKAENSFNQRQFSY